jgi:hypothetical protein
MSRPTAVLRSAGSFFRGVTWVLACGVVALPFLTPGSPVSLVPVALEQSQQLAITGSVDGLRPGQPAHLTLTVHNRSGADSAVSTLTVRVAGASAGCSAGALSVGRWSGHLVVPAHRSVQAAVPVTLHDAAGRCANATWQLVYNAS